MVEVPGTFGGRDNLRGLPAAGKQAGPCFSPVMPLGVFPACPGGIGQPGLSPTRQEGRFFPRGGQGSQENWEAPQARPGAQGEVQSPGRSGNVNVYRMFKVARIHASTQVKYIKKERDATYPVPLEANYIQMEII